MKISLNRAIGKLSILEDRIQKATKKVFITTKKQSDNGLNGHTVDEIKKQITSDIQSVQDLIAEKTKLKTAISIANATNTVYFNGKDMTIAEILVVKDFVIENKKNLLQELKLQYKNAYNFVDTQNSKLEKEVEKYLEAFSDKKVAELEKLKELYCDGKKYETIEAKELKIIIESLEKEIEAFEMEVNYALTDFNAKIEVEI